VKILTNPFYRDDEGFYEVVWWALISGNCAWCGEPLSTNEVIDDVLSIECLDCEWGLSVELNELIVAGKWNTAEQVLVI
jgi:hypothetical protein